MSSIPLPMPKTRLRFRPKRWPTLAALALLALMLAAGNWQLSRAEFKRQLQAQYDAAASMAPVDLSRLRADTSLQYRRVSAAGKWLPQRAILIDNKVYHGVVGYHLIMPFEVAGTQQTLLVNRGWLARSAPIARIVSQAGTGQFFSGLAVLPNERFVELDSHTIEGNVWQNLSLQRYRQRSGLDVAPILVEENNPAADGLIREWRKPDAGVDKHLGYAFQWFCMAATLVALYVFYSCKRRA